MSLRSFSPLQGTIPGWIPSDKSGLQFWFAADRGVTTTNSPFPNAVVTWNDLSGNGRHATGGDGSGSRPVLTANQQNGLPAIVFAAANNTNMGFGTDAVFTTGNAFTYFMVIQATVGVNTERLIVCARSSVSQRVFMASRSTWSGETNLLFGYGGGSGTELVRATDADFVTSPAIGIISYNGGTTTSPGSWAVQESGVDRTIATGVNYNVDANTNSRIGSWTTSPNDSWYNGKIMEMGAYDSSLTTDERNNLNGYLSRKWGITLP